MADHTHFSSFVWICCTRESEDPWDGHEKDSGGPKPVAALPLMTIIKCNCRQNLPKIVLVRIREEFSLRLQKLATPSITTKISSAPAVAICTRLLPPSY